MREYTESNTFPCRHIHCHFQPTFKNNVKFPSDQGNYAKLLASVLPRLESPASIDDVLRPSDIGRLQKNNNLQFF